jgi:tRNA threonylcarbamoyladenosine biosynthesis protein TsaB
MLLAIDTSTAIASVALIRAGELLAEHSWRSGRNHTTQLLPRIEEMLAESEAEIADLTAVGVALGPGSFNGLRVGLTTAKLLALSRSLPIVGVNTLEATAFQHAGRDGLVRPVYDAGRGQVATALYRAADNHLTELQPPTLASLDTLTAVPTTPVLFCGELRPAWVSLIQASLGERALLVGAAGRLRRAGYLGELCERRLATGHAADPATLQPLYLRRPPVLEQGGH